MPYTTASLKVPKEVAAWITEHPGYVYFDLRLRTEGITASKIVSVKINSQEVYMLKKKTPEELEQLVLTDMMKHPRICRPGMRYLMAYPDLVKAWHACDDPSFLCWFLDFMNGSFETNFYKVPAGESFIQAPWRLLLYYYFARSVWNCPPWVAKLIVAACKRWYQVALYAYWVTTGYFDDGTRQYWGPVCAFFIKEAHTPPLIHQLRELKAKETLHP